MPRQTSKIRGLFSVGNMYGAIISARNTEVTLRWSRTQIFLVINIPALSAAIPLVLRKPPYLEFPLILTLCAAGILVGILWIFTVSHANEWVDFWISKMKEIERTGAGAPVKVFRSEELEQIHRNRTFPFHRVLTFLAWSFTLTWLGLGTVALTRTYFGI